MLFLKPHEVVIEKRQRKTFTPKPLDDLEESIDALGLLHPPVIRVRDGQNFLVAGERRVRACLALIALGKAIATGTEIAPPGTIPFLSMGDLDDVTAYEAELAENIHREGLTWQERAVAESALLELRALQNAHSALPPPTLTQIATEIIRREAPNAPAAQGNAITAVATRIRLAAHLDDPEVANAKSEAEALKVIRKKDEAVRVQALAAAYDAAPGRNNPHTLLVGDARLHLGSLAQDSVDCLLTDPPYGINADTFGEQSGQGHEYEDSPEYFEDLMASLAEESYRVCKPEAHAYVFCDPRRFSDISLHFSLAGWKVWPIPLIWAKGNGMLPRPDHAPRRTYEAILFATKGEKPVRCVKSDVISISGVRNLQHGAQKPVDLYVDLLSRSVVPGDTVLDAFAGSGTIFPAATLAKVKAIGIEVSSSYAAIARLRMEEGDEETSGDELQGLEELS